MMDCVGGSDYNIRTTSEPTIQSQIEPAPREPSHANGHR